MTTEQPALPSFNSQQLLSELQQTRAPLPIIRGLLKRLQEDAFCYFRHSLDAATLVTNRALLIDQLLQTLWQYSQLGNTGICLVAVGGYGRSELHPYSDIDVLILSDNEHTLAANADALSQFITLLWDSKLDVGHSVRSLSQSVEAAKELTVITNMMESRPIAGDSFVHSRLLELISVERIWPAADFFKAKWDELRERHQKHNDAEYNLEPNVKNSPGTMRDIQTITWATMRYFGVGHLKALLDNGFLTEPEYERLRRNLQFFWQVRYALHMLAGREEDRLLFDLQRQVAEVLGFKGNKKQRAVELFMGRFYRHQLATQELCDLLLLHFNEDFMKAGKAEVIDLNQHFVLHNGYLLLKDSELFAKQPHWLLEIFLLMQHTQNAIGIHSNTIRALRQHRYLIDDDFRKNPKHNAIFMQMIRSPKWVVRELKRMMRYGILGRYITDFGHIIGMMEHDLFHAYTVDEHSFRMLRLLRKLRIEKPHPQFVLASDLIKTLPKKEILYLVALLHDTGKSKAGNHADSSAKIAARFCKQHQLSDEDTQLVRWLCAQHLLMSKASQRIEFNNPDEIHAFALKVGSIERLHYLYLISVTDIYSTNPKHWTPWRSEQLNSIYRQSLSVFERGLDNPLAVSEHIAQVKQCAFNQLLQLGLNQQRIESIWESANDDYFIREHVDDIVWHSHCIFRHGNSTAPLVAIRPTSTLVNEGATQIFIFMKDQENLFAATTATLDQLNLNIQDARIMTSANERNVVDTYVVLDEHNQPITNPERLETIRQSLIQALATPENYRTIINRRTPRALKQFKVETQVSMSTDTNLESTKLEIIAADRPGLLARIGSVFARLGAQIQAAKILTEGEQVSDIFYILNANGQPYANLDECLELKTALIQELDAHVAAQSAF
ncbi:MAG: [protein-PII] uridylyltransferase [Venatoribacter sp.]